ncbi:putative nucleoside-diphosphate kinase [Helianthus annuus]|nr:probable nucleoside diphosphate kinase 5 isoform X2 [Helianthus annuus]XP_021977140.1 probable nucleoside diphosphate kinase 5 isoform X2 [Helianthus annuus]KAJ0546353.1 putative nucleoside-diphosphate kinase [Helianthus annuus]
MRRMNNNNNNLRFCFGDLILLAWLLSCCRSLAIESELTLAIVKPDGISGNYSSSIRNIILQSGFTIQTQATLHLDEHTVTTFYAEHSTKTFFPSLIKYITSGPVLIMVLEKVNAIADWRTLIGPTDARKAKITHPDSIRAMCGEDLERNCVHGSDSRESAAREISFFFPHLLSGGTTLKHDEL